MGLQKEYRILQFLRRRVHYLEVSLVQVELVGLGQFTVCPIGTGLGQIHIASMKALNTGHLSFLIFLKSVLNPRWALFCSWVPTDRYGLWAKGVIRRTRGVVCNCTAVSLPLSQLI